MKVPLGIEIGERHLKLVAIESRDKQSGGFNCVVEPAFSLNDEQIKNIVSETISKKKWKPKIVILCLPRNLVTVRTLHLPSLKTEEINQMIDLHISRIVPYRKEEIFFSHRFLESDEMGYAKVVLAIVHNEILRRQTRILDSAGLTIDRIVLSSYGAWQWTLTHCRSEIKEGNLYLLLDIDSIYTDFIIFHRGCLLFTRSIGIGREEFSQEGGITKFLSEVKQSLVFFQSEEVNKKPTMIFIAGTGQTQNLEQRVQEEFDLPVKNVLVPVSSQGDVSLTAVAELTLRKSDKDISFILPELQIKKSLKEKTKELVLVGSLVIYLIAVIVFTLWGKVQAHQVYLDQLTRQTHWVEQDVGDLVVQAKRIDQVREILDSRKLPFLMLYDLQKVVPQEISIQSVTIDELNKITLRGQGAQLSDVFKFITVLEGSRPFKEVQTKSTRTKKVQDREVTDFEISFQSTLL